MSETADRDGDQAWFEAIEKTFIRLRGAPLLLSPADWQVARRWRRQGIPLELIEQTLEQVFLQRAERGARDKVNSLRYCAQAVEAAWSEMQDLLAGGSRRESVQPPDVASRLRSLASKIPETLPDCGRVQREIRALGGTPEEVETRLKSIEEDLLQRSAADLSQGERRAMEAEVDAALGRLSARLSAEEYERTRGLLMRRALRRRLELPELSLFATPAT